MEKNKKSKFSAAKLDFPVLVLQIWGLGLEEIFLLFITGFVLTALTMAQLSGFHQLVLRVIYQRRFEANPSLQLSSLAKPEVPKPFNTGFVLALDMWVFLLGSDKIHS